MAAALVTYSRLHGVEPSVEVNDLEVIAGEGVTAVVDNRRIHIGNARLGSRLGWITTAIPKAGCINTEGTTVGYVGVDERLVGVFSVGDQSRAEAAEAVNELKKLGLQPVMLTGDTHAAAKNVQTQIDAGAEMKVYSELLPEDKMRIIGKLRKDMGMTGMVGDGINDAPALASADVGIAMGVTGSSVAMETADIALMSNDIRKIAAAVKLGRKSLVKIYQNVAFSLIVKAVFIFLAFTGRSSLWAAVLADMGTCLLVIFNSMLLLDGKAYQKLSVDHHNSGDRQIKQRTPQITTVSCSKSTAENETFVRKCKSVLHPDTGCGSACLKPRNGCCENPVSNDELYVPLLLSDETDFTNNLNDSTRSSSRQPSYVSSCSSCGDCKKNIVSNVTNERHFITSEPVDQRLEIIVDIDTQDSQENSEE